MAPKDDTLTSRQRQSRQIMREKTAKKKRKALLKKLAIIGGLLGSVTIVGGGLWAWKSGAAMRAVQFASDWGYGMTSHAGYTVQDIYIEGRNRTPIEEIDKALALRKGDPILRFSIMEIRERLEKIESIKVAAVERALPGTIYVRVVEREPVAMWQHQGQMALVDDNGVVMTGLDVAPYQHLPLIVGDAAPQNVKELLAILASEPELSKKLASAIRVSDRRWNIRITSGEKGEVEVRLPEINPVAAWKKLADLQTKEQVLDRDVKVIDLRIDGKMFIQLAPDTVHGKDANARET